MIADSTIYGRKRPGSYFIDLDQSEVLSDISVDDFNFKVTLHPWLDGRCVLWFRDERVGPTFEALGHFTTFDKRNILYFVARYATSQKLREEIEHRRFERRLDGMNRSYFERVERLSRKDKTAAFRSLFNLDIEIDPTALAKRRRLMVRKFHPDVGGDNEMMTLINQAYDHLAQTVAKPAV